MAPGKDAVTEYKKMLVATQQTLDTALNERNYKGGAFRNQINARTPPIDTLKILLASDLVTEHEKTRAFRPWLKALIGLQNKDIANMSAWGLMSELVGAMEWINVFDEDRRARGEYVPPLMAQRLRDEETVNQTITIDDDGVVEETDGGALFEVPGAPADFNAAQAEYAVELGLKKKLAAYL